MDGWNKRRGFGQENNKIAFACGGPCHIKDPPAYYHLPCQAGRQASAPRVRYLLSVATHQERHQVLGCLRTSPDALLL